jgi:hypothetical protein
MPSIDGSVTVPAKAEAERDRHDRVAIRYGTCRRVAAINQGLGLKERPTGPLVAVQAAPSTIFSGGVNWLCLANSLSAGRLTATKFVAYRAAGPAG